MFTNIFWAFTLFGVAHGVFYSFFRVQIFEYKGDKGYIRVDGKYPMEISKSAPISWRIEHFLHVFLGVIIGWWLLWILLDKRLEIFQNPSFKNLGSVDLVLFILAWIGLNGGLPSVAHSVEKWFGLKT